YHFLRKQGIDVRMCFGVNYKKNAVGMETAEMEGHAWLLLNGDAFLELKPEMPRNYTMTYCFPGGQEGVNDSAG
ncbi:MAG: lasso peptide biosynthesis protein, partial [Nitrospirota bacterium]